MPPRIPYSPAARPLAQPLRQDVCTSCLRQAFSTSSTHALPTKLRREMFGWINGPGENLRYPKPNSTNYLTDYNRAGRPVARTPRNDAGSSGPDTVDSKALEDAAGESTQTIKDHRDKLKPFPLNEHFISEPVLSEELRQEIWRRVQVEGKSVRHVSVELGVEMRRVGAVVRLVEVERRMKAEGKPLALPYARAVLSMLPQTPYHRSKPVAHESINDLPVHTLTHPQIFYPSSESRPFNRRDAGRVFSGAPLLPNPGSADSEQKPMWQDTKRELTAHRDKYGLSDIVPVLKSADSRIPHPHLVALAEDEHTPALKSNPSEIAARYTQRLDEEAARRVAERERRIARQEAATTRLQANRWEFVVTDVQSTTTGTGHDGRLMHAPGHRYGVPNRDRKKGTKRIPQRVEV